MSKLVVPPRRVFAISMISLDQAGAVPSVPTRGDLAAD
jgi:hypothetical protein